MQKASTGVALATAFLVASMLTLATPTPANAQACDAACQLFEGKAALVKEPGGIFAAPIRSHVETSSVRWRGRDLMYYRTFVSPSTGETCPIPQGIALATSSNRGNTWIAVDGGRPLTPLQTVQDGQSCTQDDSVSGTWIYAPDVIADGNRLVMVFEQRDHDPDWFGPGQGRSLHSIRYVTSRDGKTWSPSTLLLRWGAVGAWDDEVGTPDLEKDRRGYVLTFHGHDSTNTLRQRRAMIRLMKLADEYTRSRTQIVLSSTPSWADFGVGMSDMIRDADGYWYIVFEAFAGASGACGRSDSSTTVGIARSHDVQHWTVQPKPLIVGIDGLSCGYDMPAWQRMGKSYAVVTPSDPPEGGEPVRWGIIARPQSFGGK